MTQPILSICIPTLNRADVLDNTLRSITRQLIPDVEFVVSDNCSMDRTQNICEGYYPMIKYIRLPVTTERGEYNYLNALQNASGNFLKLHNDNFPIVHGGISTILEIINNHSTNHPVIFFANNPDPSVPYIIKCQGFDSFIDHVSYMCTWIGGFGLWKEDFKMIKPIFLREKDRRLCQVDMLRELISVYKKDVVIVNKYLFPCIDVGGKGTGWNVAEVFGKNYLDMIADYVSTETFQKEKKRLLIELIIPYYFDNSGKHRFERSGFLKYMTHYWNDEFFYEEIERLLMENNHAE